ncbi:MAG: CDP-alcohol phosphatidyltransferase family protein [Myxococcales bacterium]|nr:CDP-alcohol phosphatidyltransferase family protein [Myxococcota bacterium]MDW8284141.1 CDP-alcohol phosphatidyltransferase family protein [Myxococcales bacterium]
MAPEPAARPGIREIYLRTRKPQEPWWNQWVSRPMAAPLVALLLPTGVTPNQVTFASAAVALGADAVLLLWRGWHGLLVAALLVQLAFVLDCVDGQLARIRGTASAVGGLLDFLMDEIKAVCLVAAVAGRLAWQHLEGTGHGFRWTAPTWFAIGLAGLAVVCCGISLTTLMRRPEYLQAVSAGAPAPSSRPGPWRRAVALLEWAGRTVLHYPGWFWLPAILDRIDLFLLPYLAAHLLHLGRAGLIVLWRLGR